MASLPEPSQPCGNLKKYARSARAIDAHVWCVTFTSLAITRQP